MQLIEIIGLGAGVCTSASSIPKIVKTNGLWVYYGVSKSDLPVYATNIVSVRLDI